MPLFKSIHKFKNKVALTSELSGPITYTQLLKYASDINKDIPKKSLIFLISQNSVASIICYVSAIINNKTIMLIDNKTNKENILRLLKLYRPSFIMAPKSWLELSKYNGLKVVKNFFEYSICKTKNSKLFDINPNLNLLLSTSGSLGSPKFVRLSKKNLKSNSNSIIKYLNIKSKDVTITTMPFSYSYMLSIINTFLESGACIVACQHSLIEKKFWSQFKKNKITSLSGVPYIYEIFIKLGLEKIYISSLKTLTQAGGKLNDSLIKKMIKFSKSKKINFYTMYGQTEASPRMSFLNYLNSEKKIGSIGKAIPNTKMWLEDEKGKMIKKPGITGELIFKGNNVSLGYCNNIKDLRRKDDNVGILRTGDLAYFDKNNFFYIKGRKNRIIKIFGNRFNLDEIENKMSKLEIEVICKEKNNKLLVFFDTNISKETVLSYITKVTGQNQLAFKCIKIDKFPRTTSGKIDYLKLDWNFNVRL